MEYESNILSQIFRDHVTETEKFVITETKIMTLLCHCERKTGKLIAAKLIDQTQNLYGTIYLLPKLSCNYNNRRDKTYIICFYLPLLQARRVTLAHWTLLPSSHYDTFHTKLFIIKEQIQVLLSHHQFTLMFCFILNINSCWKF